MIWFNEGLISRKHKTTKSHRHIKFITEVIKSINLKKKKQEKITLMWKENNCVSKSEKVTLMLKGGKVISQEKSQVL